MEEGKDDTPQHEQVEVEVLLTTKENASGIFRLARFSNGNHNLTATYNEEDIHGNKVKKKIRIPLDENHPLVLNTDWDKGVINLKRSAPSSSTTSK